MEEIDEIFGDVRVIHHSDIKLPPDDKAVVEATAEHASDVRETV